MKDIIPLTIAAFVFAYPKAAPAAYFDPNWSPTVTFDSTPAWPLCGAVQENDPSYQTGGNCPAARHGNAAYADVIDSPYGPRLGDSGHDFHRGLDLLTSNMTNTSPPQPVFAVVELRPRQGLLRRRHERADRDRVLLIREGALLFIRGQFGSARHV